MNSEQPTNPIKCRTLTPQEARVLDRVMESLQHHGLKLTTDTDTSTAPANPATSADTEAQTVQKIEGWLATIGECPAETPPADLMARTMERVADARRKEWFATQAQALAVSGRGNPFRWSELGAVAAILVVGLSLLLPMLSNVRVDARRVACANNLAVAGASMGGYAADYNNTLPRRGDFPGEVWWNVGKEHASAEPIQSNSAHLYAMIRSGHISANSLNCPENQHAPRYMTGSMHDWPNANAVSYSYQNQFTPKAVRIDRAPGMAILADKNPLFTARLRGEGLAFQGQMSPNTPSRFHGNRGQNILTGDGNVSWSANPTLSNGDNIWLLNGVRQYNGTETPTGDDSFLVP